MKINRCTDGLVERAPIEFGELTLSGLACGADTLPIRANTSIERGVNATDHRCEWWLPMASWDRMPLLHIYTCPQEPWEAQK